MFRVTYEIVTQESAEQGDAAERGWIEESCTLREAITALFQTRTSRVSGVESIECDEYPVRSPRWITVNNGMEYETGDYESRSLHMPDNLSDATRIRIARLCGVRC